LGNEFITIFFVKATFLKTVFGKSLRSSGVFLGIAFDFNTVRVVDKSVKEGISQC
jgi:hypothetical protein